MKDQIISTMRLAFVIKLLTKNQFFTLAPLPDFIQPRDNSSGELDIDLKSPVPNNFTYKFFIAKDSNELRLGNFYAVEVLKPSNRVAITHHLSYEDQARVLLDEACCYMVSDKNFGCSEELIESLKSLFENRQ